MGKIESLEEKVDRLNDMILDLTHEVWLLQNPYKFEIGDKVQCQIKKNKDHGIIVDRQAHPQLGKRYRILYEDERVDWQYETHLILLHRRHANSFSPSL